MLLFRWKNNELMTPDYSIDDFTSGTSTLTLDNLTSADRGTYKCVSEAADSQTTWTTLCHVYVFSKE